MALEKCPRCKQNVLNRSDCGESGLYRSQHLICEPCFHAEFDEIDEKGTNDLPETLAGYGPPNDFD
ncbi:hypothetical protein EVB91_187 [Rhizobium phage RHph_I1_18]|nr:hypothetical protein EVB91_187 [Rhizobium phage RHph_I1_18]